jgi:hypothetical protein
VDRAVDQHGQVIDVLVSPRRDADAARRFFEQAIDTATPLPPRIAGHALVQNVRRGHYELAVDEPARQRLAIAFAELALVVWSGLPPQLRMR